MAGGIKTLGRTPAANAAKAPIFDDWPPEAKGVLMGFWRALFAGLVLVPTIRRPRWRPLLVPLEPCPPATMRRLTTLP